MSAGPTKGGRPKANVQLNAHSGRTQATPEPYTDTLIVGIFCNPFGPYASRVERQTVCLHSRGADFGDSLHDRIDNVLRFAQQVDIHCWP
jgi:hypothetical protein